MTADVDRFLRQAPVDIWPRYPISPGGAEYNISRRQTFWKRYQNNNKTNQVISYHPHTKKFETTKVAYITSTPNIHTYIHTTMNHNRKRSREEYEKVYETNNHIIDDNNSNSNNNDNNSMLDGNKSHLESSSSTHAVKMSSPIEFQRPKMRAFGTSTSVAAYLNWD